TLSPTDGVKPRALGDRRSGHQALPPFFCSAVGTPASATFFSSSFDARTQPRACQCRTDCGATRAGSASFSFGCLISTQSSCSAMRIFPFWTSPGAPDEPHGTRRAVHLWGLQDVDEHGERHVNHDRAAVVPPRGVGVSAEPGPGD